jgi:UDP-N-acetylmuramyl pentapeptide phosphotransferase/UDP-N-acetylglucosamine-1-phosphate transferase
MTYLLLGFLVATLVTLCVIRTAHHHAHLSSDSASSGPQKFHHGLVPRVGGLGIAAGTFAALGLMYLSGRPEGRTGLLLLLCAVPAFGAGLIEDLTKKVSPGKRLLATAVSAGLAVWLLGAVLHKTDIPGLDWLMGFSAFAVIATVFTVAGVANAVNIIDGFNGLASMCAALMLTAFGGLAYLAGDMELVLISLITVCAVMGFFVWNYPRGLIFLGDGGAYFLGFMVAEVGILLVVRHPQVSPLVALMVCIYPVFETVFSIYRRRFLRAVPPGLPDGIHLHSLIYRRLVRWAAGPRDSSGMTARNSAVAPYLWTLCLASLAPAILFWDDSALLGLSIGIFAFIYVFLYWGIVRFRTPVILKAPRGFLRVLIRMASRSQNSGR